MDTILLGTLAAVVYLALCIGVGKIAEIFERSFSVWLLLALLNPVVACVVLLVVGNSASRREEDRIRTQHPEISDPHDAATNVMICPTCGVSVNLATGDGVHSTEKEQWRRLCDACGADLQIEG